VAFAQSFWDPSFLHTALVSLVEPWQHILGTYHVPGTTRRWRSEDEVNMEQLLLLRLLVAPRYSIAQWGPGLVGQAWLMSLPYQQSDVTQVTSMF
jgi:hypothetical protein